MISHELSTRLDELVATLTTIEAVKHAQAGYTHAADIVQWYERKKYCAIDFITPSQACGAWLVDKETGELYNIQGYGRPDMNKKRKANLGNVFTVDPELLYLKRYNYLR